ncbi:MAG: hypothetical protein JWP87_3516, partial [Labilithrix sp.]|nr:hypothetical protein [Labilithrix sp.]
MSRVAEVTSARAGPLLALLGGDALAVHMRGAIGPERAEKWASGVLDARSSWVTDFEGAQFSLGRAWYTHLEQDRTGEYFAGVAASDAT